jgi:hypothetical protein
MRRGIHLLSEDSCAVAPLFRLRFCSGACRPETIRSIKSKVFSTGASTRGSSALGTFSEATQSTIRNGLAKNVLRKPAARNLVNLRRNENEQAQG